VASIAEWRPEDPAALPLLSLVGDREALAALVVGIDRLRDVVDALGPAAGDVVIQATAVRLEAVRRDGMMLAPLFGDAFALLVPGLCEEDEALALAGELHAAASRQVVVADQELPVSVSVGVALGSEVGGSPQGALRDAAAAQHRAQRLGGGRIELFTAEFGEGALEALRLEGELRAAVDDGGLSLFFQPIVSLASGELSAVEALVRWDHPTLGLLLPSRFLPLAERTGILPQIERWVLREACKQLASWEQPHRVSVNVSGGALSDPGFVSRVAAELRRNELQGDQLIIELSESDVLPAQSATRVEELRALGVAIYLGEVGSGYSWLTRRQRLPVDGLKLARSLVAELESPEVASLASLIVSAARTLGLPVIAEGVENRQQLERVRVLGVSGAQGLHFLGPVPARTLSEVLALSRERPAPPGGLQPATIAEDRAVTLGQAAKLLGISASTLRRWTEDGRVNAVRTSGGHRRFRLSELTRLRPSGASQLRVPAMPDTAIPGIGDLLQADGVELATAVGRSLYAGPSGWFGRPEAIDPLRAWVGELAVAFDGGNYEPLADSLRRLMLSATVGAATLAERHMFLERFAIALETRLVRRERPQREHSAARRTIAALQLAQLADCAEQSAAPRVPVRRRLAKQRRDSGQER
jgi:diguanylate cyclase (GGDEF)-like protein/excisionase family DNA binding protein